MSPELLTILQRMDKRPGAIRQDIDEVAAAIAPKTIPEEYLSVMRYSNGIEGWPGRGAYLQLYAINDLPKLNTRAAVDELLREC